MLLDENFPFGCCVGGFDTLGIPGTICRLSCSHSLGNSRDHNDLSCSSLCVYQRGLDHSRPVFYHYTGLRVLVGIGPPSGIVRRQVAARSRAQCAKLVMLADLANYTHTGPLCVIVSGIAYSAPSSCILLWNGRGLRHVVNCIA